MTIIFLLQNNSNIQTPSQNFLGSGDVEYSWGTLFGQNSPLLKVLYHFNAHFIIK